jgi:hypothetical protein
VFADRDAELTGSQRSFAMSSLRIAKIAGRALVFTLLLSLVSTSRAQDNPTATLYVLAVGVNGSRHADKKHLLESPPEEAAAIGELFKAQEEKLFQRVEVTTLRGADGTRANILRELQKLRRQAKKGDMIVVYFAGHGGDCQKQWVYETYDLDDWAPTLTGVMDSDLRDILGPLPGQGITVVLFLETCHAGMVDLYKDGVVVFAACLPEQSSYSTRLSGSLFTRALKEGLSGEADQNHDGVVTLAELDVYLTSRVAQLKARLEKSRPKEGPISQQVVCGRPTSVPSNLSLVKVPTPPAKQPPQPAAAS